VSARLGQTIKLQADTTKLRISMRAPPQYKLKDILYKKTVYIAETQSSGRLVLTLLYIRSFYTRMSFNLYCGGARMLMRSLVVSA